MNDSIADMNKIMEKMHDLMDKNWWPAKDPLADKKGPGPQIPPSDDHANHHVDNFTPPDPRELGLQYMVKEYPFYTDDMKFHYYKVILYAKAMDQAHEYEMARKDAETPPPLDENGQPIVDVGRYTYMTDEMQQAYQEMVKHAQLLDQAYQAELARRGEPDSAEVPIDSGSQPDSETGAALLAGHGVGPQLHPGDEANVMSGDYHVVA